MLACLLTCLLSLLACFTYLLTVCLLLLLVAEVQQQQASSSSSSSSYCNSIQQSVSQSVLTPWLPSSLVVYCCCQFLSCSPPTTCQLVYYSFNLPNLSLFLSLCLSPSFSPERKKVLNIITIHDPQPRVVICTVCFRSQEFSEVRERERERERDVFCAIRSVPNLCVGSGLKVEGISSRRAHTRWEAKPSTSFASGKCSRLKKVSLNLKVLPKVLDLWDYPTNHKANQLHKNIDFICFVCALGLNSYIYMWIHTSYVNTKEKKRSNSKYIPWK